MGPLDNAAVPPRAPAPAPAPAVAAQPGYFVSEFLGERVLDVARRPVGKVRDFVVATGEKSPFPRITGLLLRDRFEDFVLPWEDVAIFQRGNVRTRLSREDLIHRAPAPDEIFLARHLLDRQIVDINGVKVVRVNDLKLDVLAGDLVLTAADVGVRGIVRRVFGSRVTPSGGRLSDASLPPRLIPWDSMQPLHPSLDRLETTLPHEKLARLHPADIAELIGQVSPKERTQVFRKLNLEMAAETLHELEPEIQAELIETLSAETASDILEQMPPDEAAEVLRDLDGSQARDLVRGMESEAAEEVAELLVHEEDTAGGLMGASFVTAQPHATVGETIERLRGAAREAEFLYYVYVVDERERPVAVVSLHELLASEDAEPLSRRAASPVRSVSADAPTDEVADMISKYDLLAVPVVDPEGTLVGVVTVDDVFGQLRPHRRKRRRLH